MFELNAYLIIMDKIINKSSNKKVKNTKKYQNREWSRFQIERQIKDGNFANEIEFQEAKRYGVVTKDLLLLLKGYNAPDVETAKFIHKNGFPNYKTYLEAKKVGANTHAEYCFIKDYENIQFRISYRKKYLSHIRSGGIIFIEKFKEIHKKIIQEDSIDGIQIGNWSYFLEISHLKTIIDQNLEDRIQISYQDIAELFSLPLKHIEELISELMARKIISGYWDRKNQLFLIKQLSKDKLTELLVKQFITTEEIKKRFSQPLEEIISQLQDYLPSRKTVITMNEDLIRIRKISISCQICGTQSNPEMYLICTKCNRKLCWEHFLKLVELGRPVCSHCKGKLQFYPRYCEKCHIDFTSRAEKNCPNCNFPLTVKKHLESSYSQFVKLNKVKLTFELGHKAKDRNLILN